MSTVQMTTREVVLWFFVIPPLAALTVVGVYVAARQAVRRLFARLDAKFQSRIDDALAYPVTFDSDGLPHSDPNSCRCDDCLALIACVRAMLGLDDWDRAAAAELDGAA